MIASICKKKKYRSFESEISQKLRNREEARTYMKIRGST